MGAKKLLTLRDIFYIFFKNKTLIVSVFVTSIVIALVYCIVTPAQYRAETKILIKIGKAQFSGVELMPEKQNLLIQERSQNIRNEIELIKGQYLTEKVIERLKGKIEPMKGDQSIFSRTFRNIKDMIKSVFTSVGITKKTPKDKGMILTFMSSLRVNFLEDTDMISLTFDWTDPKFAALVANLYADEYILQHTLVNESQRSHKFYNEQIELTDKRLKETEDNLQMFLKDTNIANISLQKELHLRNLAELENKYNLAALDVSQAVAKIKKIKEMAAQPNVWIETPEMGSTMVNRQEYLRTIDESYFRLKSERQRLLKIYTTEAAEIKSIDAQLDNLRKQKADSLLNIANMELSLAENRKSSLAKDVENERKILNDVNSKTYLLRQLERDRELTELSYQMYKKKGEELRISDDLDSQRISSVRIATPAIPPLTPTYPKKGFIIIASAMIGLFLSFGFSAIREFFNHTFRDDADIDDILGVPFLIAVPMRNVSGNNGVSSSNDSSTIANVLNKILHRNGKKTATTTTSFITATPNGLAFIVLVIIGICGYFIYLYQSMMFFQNTIAMQRFISHDTQQTQQVMFASINPTDNVFLGRQNQESKNEVSSEDKNIGMDLLSDKMEQRRIELEKRRALLEVELEKIKSEIEISRMTKEQKNNHEAIQQADNQKAIQNTNVTPVQMQTMHQTNMSNVPTSTFIQQKSHNIRNNLPIDNAGQNHNKIIDNTSKKNEDKDQQEYVVGTNETLVSILRDKYNIPTHLIYNESINLIRTANPGMKNLNSLAKGQKILIPKEVIEFAKK